MLKYPLDGIFYIIEVSRCMKYSKSKNAPVKLKLSFLILIPIFSCGFDADWFLEFV